MPDLGNKDPRKNKPQGNERFQPRAFLIWFIAIASIFALWSIYPNEQGNRERWSFQQVLEASNEGRIVKGTIKGDPSRGREWYVIQGDARPVSSTTTVTGQAAAKNIRFSAEGRLTDNKFNELMASKGGLNLKEKPSSTLLTEIISSLLPFLLIIGLLYFLFMRQIKMAGRGAMSFGKSRARLMTKEEDRVTFEDVAGCDEAKEEVSEVVDFLKNPKKYEKIGGRIPKGMLMVGPPGTGKTLLARAVAGEADVPFFSISGSDFVEMFVGVGAARVRDMFEQGRKNAPCIIFIDEIDAVGRQRGAGLGGGNDEREQTLNSILVEMDGFDGREGVIIMAATNRPDVLDKALLRPGRFDRQVTIDLPDLNGREQILKVHAKKIKLADDVDLSVVARSTPGFSGADLENLLNESALMAARGDEEQVTHFHIEQARDKVAFGHERKKLMDDDDKKVIAFHEAGHAIVQAVIGDDLLPVHKVTIIPRGQSLGSTTFIPKKDILNYPKQHLLNQVCCSMGGRVAEELEIGEITSGASGDIRMATKLARHMVCDWGMSDLGMVSFGANQEHIFLGKEIARDENYSEQTAQKIDAEIRKVIDTQYARATKILKEHEAALKTCAEALLKHETIDGKHVDEILKEGKIVSQVGRSKPKKVAKKKPEAKATKEDKESVEIAAGEASPEANATA